MYVYIYIYLLKNAPLCQNMKSTDISHTKQTALSLNRLHLSVRFVSERYEPTRIRTTHFHTRGQHRSRPATNAPYDPVAHSCLVFVSSPDSCLSALVSTSLLWQHTLIVTPLASRTPPPPSTNAPPPNPIRPTVS